jgi:TonB family protein
LWLVATTALTLMSAAAQPPAAGAEPDTTATVSLAEAEQALEAAVAAHGRDSLELVPALMDAAGARAGAGDHAAAAAGYAEAVRLVETRRGAMDLSLLEPLRGLGLSHNAAGNYARGAEAFERALHVLRVHSGLYHVGQYELLDALAASYAGLGRGADAEFKQRAALQLIEREYGHDDLRIAPALGRLADWYHEQGRLFEERETLERQIGVLEGALGEHDVSLIEPLRAVALSYRLEYSPLPEGERALERAIAIHERHAGDAVGHAETLAALGDWYLVFKKRVRAFAAYAKAQALLPPDDVERLFGAPVPLLYLPPRAPAIDENTPAEDIAEGFVLVEYAVTESGRVDDIRLVESEPAAVMDHRVIKALSGARFRPRIARGTPVPTGGLRLRHPFSYSERALPAPE